MITENKKVALDLVHKSLGAKIVGFAGFDMPVRYSSDNDEHLCVRQKVGVFDVSHMGEFRLKGANALDLIQKVCSNDASVLINGKVQYTCLPNGKGGIVDDLLVYKIADDEYYLVVNASNIEKDWDWISSQNVFGVEMKNESESTSLLALQGPLSSKVLSKLTKVAIEKLENYSFTFGSVAGISDVLISATGYTGSGGYELYVPNNNVEKLWKALFEAGVEFGIQPIGLGARDTLRLEKGFCLYGNDIDDTTSPLEAGLGWITKFNKDFIDKSFLENQKANGISKKLIGFKMAQSRSIPRSHYKIKTINNIEIGDVTSGTMSPILNIGIGLGYVSVENAKIGNIIMIEIRNQLFEAEICKLPFVN